MIKPIPILIFIVLIFGCKAETPSKEVSNKVNINKQENPIRSHIKSLTARSQRFVNGDESITILDYILEDIVEENKREQIVDYHLMEILQTIERSRNYLLIKDTLSTGEYIEAKLSTSLFDTTKHEFVYLDYGPVDSIDGQVAHYGDSIPYYPLHEINNFFIKINDKNIDIPQKMYSNLYDIHIMDDTKIWRTGTNLFYDKQSDLLHFYFSGGSVSGTYFAKLVFSKSECTGKYVLDYDVLSSFGCFTEVFPGF